MSATYYPAAMTTSTPSAPPFALPTYTFSCMMPSTCFTPSYPRSPQRRRYRGHCSRRHLVHRCMESVLGHAVPHAFVFACAAHVTALRRPVRNAVINQRLQQHQSAPVRHDMSGTTAAACFRKPRATAHPHETPRHCLTCVRDIGGKI